MIGTRISFNNRKNTKEKLNRRLQDRNKEILSTIGTLHIYTTTVSQKGNIKYKEILEMRQTLQHKPLKKGTSIEKDKNTNNKNFEQID